MREFSPRETELLHEEHVLELQLEGMFRDLHNQAVQRGLLRQARLHMVTITHASVLMNRIRDIEIELREIAHKLDMENPPEPDIGISFIKVG